MTDDDDLADLVWNWSGAYSISHPAPDRWLAQRRDSPVTLRAESPGALRDLILADYTARPVPRTYRDDG